MTHDDKIEELAACVGDLEMRVAALEARLVVRRPTQAKACLTFFDPRQKKAPPLNGEADE